MPSLRRCAILVGVRRFVANNGLLMAVVDDVCPEPGPRVVRAKVGRP
jgi:hypothetical protein